MDDIVRARVRKSTNLNCRTSNIQNCEQPIHPATANSTAQRVQYILLHLLLLVEHDLADGCLCVVVVLSDILR